MKKENNLSSVGEYENWITFYINYLNPYFSEEDFLLFQKKWQSYWKLFQYWKEKKLDNQKINAVVKELKETPQLFTSLIEKYEKKTKADYLLIEQELKNLWSTELDQKVITDRQRIQNYLLGQIKRKFSEYPLNEVVPIIINFLQAKTQK